MALTLRLPTWRVQVPPVLPEWEAYLYRIWGQDSLEGHSGAPRAPDVSVSALTRNREPWGPRERAVPALVGPALGPAGGGARGGRQDLQPGPSPSSSGSDLDSLGGDAPVGERLAGQGRGGGSTARPP